MLNAVLVIEDRFLAINEVPMKILSPVRTPEDYYAKGMEVRCISKDDNFARTHLRIVGNTQIQFSLDPSCTLNGIVSKLSICTFATCVVFTQITILLPTILHLELHTAVTTFVTLLSTSLAVFLCL